MRIVTEIETFAIVSNFLLSLYFYNICRGHIFIPWIRIDCEYYYYSCLFCPRTDASRKKSSRYFSNHRQNRPIWSHSFHILFEYVFPLYPPPSLRSLFCCILFHHGTAAPPEVVGSLYMFSPFAIILFLMMMSKKFFHGRFL